MSPRQWSSMHFRNDPSPDNFPHTKARGQDFRVSKVANCSVGSGGWKDLPARTCACATLSCRAPESTPSY
eukprot:12848780-Alexandrium_andersonii.AAC.1